MGQVLKGKREGDQKVKAPSAADTSWPSRRSEWCGWGGATTIGHIEISVRGRIVKQGEDGRFFSVLEQKGLAVSEVNGFHHRW